jgi:hypothetical protein
MILLFNQPTRKNETDFKQQSIYKEHVIYTKKNYI